MKLEYKILYNDLLVFKNANDCMTINDNYSSDAEVQTIEIEGEVLDVKDWQDVLKNSFTKIEMDDWCEFYAELKENHEL